MIKEFKILIADPEEEELINLMYFLKKENFVIYTASTGPEVIEKAKRYAPDLIIMEVALPMMDGIEVCYSIREDPGTAQILIAFYTTRTEDYIQVSAFHSGADDYMIKPLAANLLTARVNALLRRVAVKQDADGSQQTGLVIDKERYLVTLDGVDISLPRKEFGLLTLLLSSPGKVFTREEIAANVWGVKANHKNRTIDVHVRKLREKLGEEYIKTIKGVGYRLNL